MLERPAREVLVVVFGEGRPVLDAPELRVKLLAVVVVEGTETPVAVAGVPPVDVPDVELPGVLACEVVEHVDHFAERGARHAVVGFAQEGAVAFAELAVTEQGPDVEDADAPVAELVEEGDGLCLRVSRLCQADCLSALPEPGVVGARKRDFPERQVLHLGELGLHPLDGAVVGDEVAFLAGEHEAHPAGETAEAKIVLCALGIVECLKLLPELDPDVVRPS